MNPHLGMLALTLALGALLVGVMATLPSPPSGATLAPLVTVHATATGASHPVTAVLLGFRAYDTLLEVVVLLLAVRVGSGFRHPASAFHVAHRDALIDALVALLVPLLVMVAVALLVTGTRQPGGAFQAGAMLAGAGVVMRLAGWGPRVPPRGRHVDAIHALGLAAFLAIGTAPLALSWPFLRFPPETATSLVLAIEAAVALSVGVGLAGLFAGAGAHDPGAAPLSRNDQ